MTAQIGLRRVRDGGATARMPWRAGTPADRAPPCRRTRNPCRKEAAS